jgi:hypothetical protein
MLEWIKAIVDVSIKQLSALKTEEDGDRFVKKVIKTIITMCETK